MILKIFQDSSCVLFSVTVNTFLTTVIKIGHFQIVESVLGESNSFNELNQLKIVTLRPFERR
jgi:hypothetical protein